jgi:hypothetical protein
MNMPKNPMIFKKDFGKRNAAEKFSTMEKKAVSEEVVGERRKVDERG